MTEEKVKEIIAKFIKVPPEQINHMTLIDRSAVGSSIMIHRMYANLSENGVVVDNYSEIVNFADLMQRIDGKSRSDIRIVEMVPSGDYPKHSGNNLDESSIGIDMEAVNSMPPCTDFREDPFYQMNFNAAEIAYCILQKDPYVSFAGLFAAKEAIVKADNTLRKKSFNTIGIDHLPEGKPVFPGFQLSISHTKELAIAVAVQSRPADLQHKVINQNNSGNQAPKSGSVVFWIGILSLILSLIAMVIALRH